MAYCCPTGQRVGEESKRPVWFKGIAAVIKVRSTNVQSLRDAHYAFSGIIKELADIFSDLILADQDCFASEEGYEALLQLIPDASIVHTLRTKWTADPDRSSSDKWEDFRALVKKASDRVR